MRLKQHSIVKVGEWTPETRLNISDRSVFFDASPMNVTLVAITILVSKCVCPSLSSSNPCHCLYQEVPYVMMHYSKNLTGNDRFYGFCVDILDRISREVGFEYILDLVPDRKYGAINTAGEWNGMVAQLMKHVSTTFRRPFVPKLIYYPPPSPSEPPPPLNSAKINYCEESGFGRRFDDHKLRPGECH